MYRTWASIFSGCVVARAIGNAASAISDTATVSVNRLIHEMRKHEMRKQHALRQAHSAANVEHELGCS